MKHLSYFALLALMLFGCDSDPADPLAGDTDSNELEVDGDEDSLDNDISDTSTDGDELDVDTVEDDSIDGDDDIDAVEDELDSDFIDSDVVEMEEIEAEQEEVDSPPLLIEHFPFAGVALSYCEEPLDLPHLNPMNQFNLVLGDGTGKIYFGCDRGHCPYYVPDGLTKNLFWTYDQVNKTMICDPAIDEDIFSMDSISTEDGIIIYLGHKNKLAKRGTDGEWSFVQIPDVGEISIPDDLYAASGLLIGPNGYIAVWHSWGLGFYNENSKTWKKFDLPAFVEQPLVLHGSWHGNKFYLPVGCKVLSWEIGTESLIEETVVDGCNEAAGDGLYVINKVENTLKIAQVNWTGEQETYGSILKSVTLDLDTNSQSAETVVDASECEFGDCFEGGCTTNQMLAYMQAVPGMAGTPPATFVTPISWFGGISNGCAIVSRVKLNSDFNDEDNKCDCGVAVDSTSVFIFTSGCLEATDTETNPSYFDRYMYNLLSNSVWQDDENLWLGSVRVSKDEL